MQNIDIFEKVIEQDRGRSFKVAILRANVPCELDKIAAINAVMDNAVSEYVGTKGHNTFVEAHLDTPNIRVIISDFNDIEFVPFDGQKL